MPIHINRKETCFMQNNFSKIESKNMHCLLIGSIILAIGINLFIAPYNLAFGGVTGITIIIQSLTGIPIFISNFILSFIVILIGWLELGQHFMVKTVIPTALLPLFLFITAPLSKFTIALPLSAIIGAVTIGIGISLTILAGGSTAGPDTIGLVLKKRFQIPITLTMIVIDVLVILCGYNIYGIRTTAWSIGVAVIMNITVKLMRIIFSDELSFRYWPMHFKIRRERL